MEPVRRIEDETERRRACGMMSYDLTRDVAPRLEQTGAKVGAVVVSDTLREYNSFRAFRTFGQHGYEHRNPLINFRVTPDPNVRELDDAQLALLVQQTNSARAAIEAEQNRRGNN